MSTQIQCKEHGRSESALICKHLAAGAGLRFYAVPSCAHGEAQAWCESCDSIVQQERGWNDASEAHADFQLFCTTCYRTSLRNHRFVEFVQGPDETCDWSAEPAPNSARG